MTNFNNLKNIELDDISNALSQADCLWSEQQLQWVYEEMAGQISNDLADRNPLVLCVMNGGLFLTAELLRRLSFPLLLNYVHATRYHDELQGGQIDWIHFPVDRVKGRQVLIVDDILDIGITLKAIQQACLDAGAVDVKSAVLAIKQHDRQIPDVEADYVGVSLEDRYVFGCGMDYKGYHRNLTAIYAVKDN